MKGLHVRPITFRDAAIYIDRNHRHHRAPQGCKFAIAAYEDDRLCGVATVGRPVSRYLDDGLTAEVTRLCTDGTKNACSLLYSACWKAAKAMGYTRIYTYTLEQENGASLRAAGWICDGEAGGLAWTGARTKAPLFLPQMKVRWHKQSQCDEEGVNHEGHDH